MDAIKMTQIFAYVIAEKDRLAIVSMTGSLSRTSAFTLRECQADIRRLEVRAVVLNFQQITGVAPEAFPELGRLCASIRERNLVLRVCSLSREIESVLSQEGAFLAQEPQDSLVHAIQSLAELGIPHGDRAA